MERNYEGDGQFSDAADTTGSQHALSSAIVSSVSEVDTSHDNPAISDYVSAVMRTMSASQRAELVTAVLTEAYRAGDHLGVLRQVLPQLSQEERAAISDELAAIAG